LADSSLKSTDPPSSSAERAAAYTEFHQTLAQQQAQQDAAREQYLAAELEKFADGMQRLLAQD
jgi:hypothetical protein